MAIGPIVTRGYGSFGTVNLVATRGYSPAAYVPTIAVTLTDALNAILPSLSGLSVAWWDQVLLVNQVAPVQKWSAQTTDTAGKLSVTSLTLSALTAGQIGWIEVTNSDGTVGNGNVAAGAIAVT